MSFISKRLSLKQSFAAVDKMFNGWFTAHGYTFAPQPRNLEADTEIGSFTSSLTGYFPNIEYFSSNQVLYGMLLMYYNYPVDWIKAQISIESNDAFYAIGMNRLACFLGKAGVEDVKREMTILTKGLFPSKREQSTGLDTIISATLSYGDILKLHPGHPFSDKRVHTLLRAREVGDDMFGRDTELLRILNNRLVELVTRYLDKEMKTTKEMNDKLNENDRIKRQQEEAAKERTKMFQDGVKPKTARPPVVLRTREGEYKRPAVMRKGAGYGPDPNKVERDGKKFVPYSGEFLFDEGLYNSATSDQKVKTGKAKRTRV